MSIDTTTPRTRRAVILGVLGGAIATVAAHVKAPAARAGVDGDLVLETTNSTDVMTELVSSAGPGLRVVGGGIGLQAWGDIAVDAFGDIAVNAISDGTAAPAAIGWSRGNAVGQLGWSTNGNQSTPTVPAKTGVFGLAEQDANARGVFGRTTVGQGVRGQATSGDAVWGEATAGRGVVARSSSNTAVDAQSTSGIGVLGIAVGDELLPAEGQRAGVYGSAGASPGVHGRAGTGPGVLGESASDAGVRGVGNVVGLDGETTDGIGVRGTSDTGPGVYASNDSASVGSVVADGGPGTGVHGHGGGGTVPTSPPTTGVYGSAAGVATGVFGDGTTGVGVRGEATTGVGVKAVATTGKALEVAGRAVFSRSGRVSVPANAKYVDVSVPGGLPTGSSVLATLQYKRGQVHVLAARPNYPSAGKCRIYLSDVASTTASTPLAWFVLG